MRKRTKILYVFGTFMLIVLMFIFALSVEASYVMYEMEAQKDCDHHWSDWYLTEIPDCLKEGMRRRECEDCGSAEYEEVQKSSHTFNEDGICTHCGGKESELAGQGSGGTGDLNDQLGGNLDDSGEIGGENDAANNANPVTIGTLYSDITAKIYLKYISFGNYNGHSWSQAPKSYKTMSGGFGMDYLFGTALGASNVKSNSVKITTLGSQYLLPYYMTMESGNYDIQSSDTKYKGDTSGEYGLNFYSYDYLVRGLPSSQVPDGFSLTESEYAKFVKTNYLAVPQSTKEFLLGVAAEQHLLPSNPGIINKVASYIRGAATYNLNFDSGLNSAEDMVIAFLSEYKEGVCRHYASAATLLYRSLGIPARYCNGFVVDAVANQYTEITTQYAHAWVEVYIDGYGWVQVEVTGGGVAVGLNQGDENCEHEFGEWQDVFEPNCKDSGLQKRECDKCGKEEERTVPPTGVHDFGDWETVEDPTCFEDGLRKHTCNDCGEVETEEIPANGEHNFGDWEVVYDPTCVDEGLEQHTCNDCGEVETQKIPADGVHDYGDWETTKDATCTEKGTEQRKCKHCDETETQDVDELGHEYKDGKCIRCNKEQAKVTISVKSVETTYSGNPVSCEKNELTCTFENIEESLEELSGATENEEEDYGFEVEENSVHFDSYINAGTYTNEQVINGAKIVNSNGEDVTNEFYVCYDGSITIDKIAITITTDSDTFSYDGKDHSTEGKYECTSTNGTPKNLLKSEPSGEKNGEGIIADGEEINVESYTTIKNVGEADNDIKISISNAENKDTTQNYEITYDYGTLTVTVCNIKITTKSAQKNYEEASKDPLTCDECTITYNGEEIDCKNELHADRVLTITLDNGATFVITFDASFSDFGSTKNTCTVKIISSDGVTDLTSNFHIEIIYGTLSTTA